MLIITPEIALADREIRERFLPATGSQSRKEARTLTAVELRLDLHASSLPKAVKWRLLALGGHRVTSQGVLVVVSRGRQSQARNREAARHHLIGIIHAAASTPKERRPTAPPRRTRPPRTTGRAHSALHRAAAGKLE